MADNSTLLYAAVIFGLGIAVGLFFRFGRFSSNVSFSMNRTPPGQPTKFGVRVNKSTNLTLKCTCGAVHKFHKGSGDAESGSEPYPEGDAYTCPNCGKSLDLGALRKLAAGSGAQF